MKKTETIYFYTMFFYYFSHIKACFNDMRHPYLNIIYILSVAVMLVTAGCKEDSEENIEPKGSEISAFTFLPEQPNSKVETSVLFQGCNYYQTTSVIIDKENIDVRKHFNSQLKRPCVLVNDTISLGKLKKGDYQVTLEIIDLNPFAEDSVFYSHTQSLTVLNK